MLRGWGFALIVVAACSGETEERSVAQAVQQCPAMTVEGVDVYAGTGTIDWTKVKAAGRDFAFIKATQGDYNKQSKFAANWANSLAAGVMRSPYHFFDATIDGVAQANCFLARGHRRAGGLQPGDLPPMLDIECPTSSSQSASARPELRVHRRLGLGRRPRRLSSGSSTGSTPCEAATGHEADHLQLPVVVRARRRSPTRSSRITRCTSRRTTAARRCPRRGRIAVFWQYSATTHRARRDRHGDVDRFFGSARRPGRASRSSRRPADPMPACRLRCRHRRSARRGCGCQGTGAPPLCEPRRVRGLADVPAPPPQLASDGVKNLPAPGELLRHLMGTPWNHLMPRGLRTEPEPDRSDPPRSCAVPRGVSRWIVDGRADGRGRSRPRSRPAPRRSPGFFRGSDVRVRVDDGPLASGCLARLDDLATRFELRIVEVAAAAGRRRCRRRPQAEPRRPAPRRPPATATAFDEEEPDARPHGDRADRCRRREPTPPATSRSRSPSPSSPRSSSSST